MLNVNTPIEAATAAGRMLSLHKTFIEMVRRLYVHQRQMVGNANTSSALISVTKY